MDFCQETNFSRTDVITEKRIVETDIRVKGETQDVATRDEKKKTIDSITYKTRRPITNKTSSQKNYVPKNINGNFQELS